MPRYRAVSLLAVAAVLHLTAAADGHIVRDTAGRMVHIGHTRDRSVYIDASGSLGAQADAARQDLASVMGTSIRLPKTTSHSGSLVHVFGDQLGASGILGTTRDAYGQFPTYHGGNHIHVRWNTTYDYADWTVRRGVMCHELGHTIGLEHSYDATDCMVTGAGLSVVGAQRTLSTAHRDQARSAWNENGGH